MIRKQNLPKPIEEVIRLCKEQMPELILKAETYVNVNTKAVFIDPVHGEFLAMPKEVYLYSKGHPATRLDRRKKTMMERYGVDNPRKSPVFQEKYKKTCLERYGVENASMLEETHNKIKETTLAKYGCEHYVQTEQHQQSMKEHNLQKYGKEHYYQTDEFREKAKAFYLEKYGVPHNMMVPELKEKMFQSKISNGNSSSSIEERTLMDWVKTHCPDAVSTYYGDVGQLDIFIPSLRLAIEYNGLYWHSQEVLANRNVPSPRLYHLDKTEKCLKNGINLIHIWSHLWIERRPQVQDYLLSKFGNITRKYGARKLRFTEIDKNIARGFCKEFHIQGSPNNVSLALGAYDGEDLISAATFGLHHRNSKQLCLNRFVTFPGVLVSGGLGKFSRMASNLVQEPLLSWADRSWSGGNAYLKAGWTLEEVLPPDYFYYDDRTKTVIPKQNRKKSVVGTPNHLTESEHARLDGLLKIWDCGKLRFAFHPISIA